MNCHPQRLHERVASAPPGRKKGGDVGSLGTNWLQRLEGRLQAEGKCSLLRGESGGERRDHQGSAGSERASPEVAECYFITRRKPIPRDSGCPHWHAVSGNSGMTHQHFSCDSNSTVERR